MVGHSDTRMALQLQIGWSVSSVPGTYAAEALVRSMPLPIGVVWYRFLDRSRVIEVLNSSVMERYRRQGVRTFIHQSLLDAFPQVDRITTEHGTRSGTAWLKATGFRLTKRNVWEFTRRP